MNTASQSSSQPVLVNLAGLLPDFEAPYKDVHSQPELSFQENSTAGLAAERLRAAAVLTVGGAAGRHQGERQSR